MAEIKNPKLNIFLKGEKYNEKQNKMGMYKNSDISDLIIKLNK